MSGEEWTRGLGEVRDAARVDGARGLLLRWEDAGGGFTQRFHGSLVG